MSDWRPGDTPFSLDWVWSSAAIAAWLDQRYAEIQTPSHISQMAERFCLEIPVQYTLQRWSALTPADTAFIAALLDFGDRFSDPPIPLAARLTLCQASLDYYQDHRIWGEPRPVAQARWGLIAIAQNLITQAECNRIITGS